MKYILPFFVLGILTTSCSSIRYVSDHIDPESQPLRGSYMIEGECEKKVSEIYEIRVSNAIHTYMRDKGFNNSENPDILIQFFLKESLNAYIAEECNYYGRWKSGENCALKVVNYEEGSIIIDIINTKNQSIVWHGVIHSPPFDYINNPNENINKYVHKLLSEYYSGK